MSGLLDKIKNKKKYGVFLHELLVKVAKLGLEIEPYYFVKEQLTDTLNDQFLNRYTDYEPGFLSKQDMGIISQKRHYHPLGHYLMRLDSGIVCFGVKYRGNLAAFTWIDLASCHFRANPFKLKNNEAYLYDAFTFEEYRGENLAPYTRFKCYEELNQRGISIFYSITDYFNKPAVQLKKKLGAENVYVGLFVEVFKKYSHNWILYRYQDRHAL